MTKIILTFICAFPEEAAQDKKKKDKAKKKNKKKKQKIEEQVEELSPNCIVLKSLDNFMHIEYNLLPGQPNCTVDVISWGPVTKVCTKKELTTIKSIKCAKYFWAVFSVEHYFILSNDHLKHLKKHLVNIKIKLNKGSVSEKVRNDKTKMFFISDEDLLSEAIFAETYLNEEDAKNVKKVDSEIMEDFQFSKPAEIHQKLHKLPIENLRKTIEQIIIKSSSKKFVECFNNGYEEYIFEEPSKGRKGKKPKKPKKPKKAKKKGKDIVTLQFSGEIFFTDHMCSLEFKENNPKLRMTFLLMNISDLMTPLQKTELNPIVINIKKLKNIPIDILAKNDFISIYAVCNMGPVLQYHTGDRLISKVVAFKDHRVTFTNDFDVLKFSEIIQTGYLIIKIYGRQFPKKKPTAVVFGHNEDDIYISDHVRKKQVKDFAFYEETQQLNSILLFIVFIKLDNLKKYSPCTTFLQVEKCIHPNNIYIKTLNKFEEKVQNLLNPLTDEILLRYGTNLEIDVKTSTNFKIPPNLELNTFKRIIIIVNNKTIAKIVLTQILLNNQGYLGPHIIIPDLTKNFLKEEKTELINIITGFTVDFENCFIMFFEGLSNGLIRNLWIQLRTVKINIKIFHNSNSVYENRLYNDLIPYGGVYVITMQVGLKFSWRDKHMFIIGKHSKDCIRAIQKLILIQRSTSIQDITYALLPSVQELLQMDLECGTPLHKKY